MGARNGAAIEVAGLTKSYGRAKALDGLDLTVASGEVHGFLGPNGSGKTTTIRILLGLLRADSGTVRMRHAVVAVSDRLGSTHVRLRRQPVVAPARHGRRGRCRGRGGDGAAGAAGLRRWTGTCAAGPGDRVRGAGFTVGPGLAATAGVADRLGRRAVPARRGLFADSFEIPGWLRRGSPFAHTPQAPLDTLTATPLTVLAILFVAFAAGGYAGFRRRDLGY